MEENSTSLFTLLEQSSGQTLMSALKSVNYGTPSLKCLENIRKFAQTFRVIDGMPAEDSLFSLN